MSAEVLGNMRRLNKEAGFRDLVKGTLKSGQKKAFGALSPRQKQYAKQGMDKLKKIKEKAGESELSNFLQSRGKSDSLANRLKNRSEQAARQQDVKQLKQVADDVGIQKKTFNKAVDMDPVADQAKNKFFKMFDPGNKFFGLGKARDPKTVKEGVKALGLHKKKAISDLVSQGVDSKQAKKWVDAWADSATGASRNRAAKIGLAGAVPGTIAANQAMGESTIDDVKTITGQAVSGVGEKTKDVLTGTNKQEREDTFDTERVAQPGNVDVPPPEQKSSVLDNVAELLDTRSGHAGIGALAGGLGSYGLQKALEDKNLTAEEKKALRKRQALITALSTLAGGGIGAGAHYFKNKRASEDRSQLVSRIQADAQGMTDDELEHRIANIKNTRMLTKQASEEKAAINQQLTTARTLGII